MRRWFIPLAAVLCATALAAEPAKSDKSPEQLEAEYTAMIEKRTADLVAKLELADESTVAAVHRIIAAQYRRLRDWHDANGPQLKELRKSDTSDAKERIESIQATLKPIHDQFLADLAAHLSPQQVEKVKDLLTYNVVHVTYAAYCDMIPRLTDEQKAKIKAWLIEAREIAMDEGSSEAKHAVFGKYKGRINNYLSKEGYNIKEEENAWRERRKAVTRKSD